jgi:hypothetical protein
MIFNGFWTVLVIGAAFFVGWVIAVFIEECRKNR